MPGDEARAMLEALAAQVAADDWQPAAPRSVGDTVLPEGMNAGAVVSLSVRVQFKDGGWKTTPVAIDVSLNEAVSGRDVARFPVRAVDAEVEVRVSIDGGYVDLRIIPNGGEVVEERFAMTCTPIIDGARAALAEPCQIETRGRWLGWDAPWGGGVQVRLDDQVVPLVIPVQTATELP
jgi:hypothetical protein